MAVEPCAFCGKAVHVFRYYPVYAHKACATAARYKMPRATVSCAEALAIDEEMGIKPEPAPPPLPLNPAEKAAHRIARIGSGGTTLDGPRRLGRNFDGIPVRVRARTAKSNT